MRSMIRDRKGWVIALVVVIVLGAGLYFAGRWQERGNAEAAREVMEARLREVMDERDRAQADLAAVQARLRLVQARALLFEAALDLERRNFGIANERLDAVTAQLERVRGGSGVADSAALGVLQREVAGMDLRVAENLAEQRSRVLDLAARLDALLQSSQSGRDDQR